MRNLFYVTMSIILTVYCMACRLKDNTSSTLHTSWRYSEGELPLRDTTLPITVYHKGASQSEQLVIEAPYQDGQYQLSVPYACIYTFTLPNNTLITLNSGSRLSFDLRSTTMRLVGEGLFKVGDTVATIYMGQQDFVHGTQGASFNISSYTDYPSEYEVETVLLAGTAIMNSRNFRDTLTKVGETLICNKSSLEKVCGLSNTAEVVSWTKNGLEYSNIPIRKLLHKIGRRYGLVISGEDNISNELISYKGSDTWTLDRRLSVIARQYPNCSYAVESGRLNVCDLTWVIGCSRSICIESLLK